MEGNLKKIALTIILSSKNDLSIDEFIWVKVQFKIVNKFSCADVFSSGSTNGLDDCIWDFDFVDWIDIMSSFVEYHSWWPFSSVSSLLWATHECQKLVVFSVVLYL